MHFPPYDNKNQPIVDVEDSRVPLNYFNIVKLKKGEAFSYQVPGYETCIAPATGSVDVDVEGQAYAALGNRGVDVWDGEPEGLYVPSGAKVTFVCVSDQSEVSSRAQNMIRCLTLLMCVLRILIWFNTVRMIRKRIAKSNIFWARNSMTKWGVCWSANCSRWGRAAGLDFPRTSMTQTACQKKPVMMKLITLGFGPITARDCKCCSAKITNRAMPIIL